VAVPLAPVAVTGVSLRVFVSLCFKMDSPVVFRVLVLDSVGVGRRFHFRDSSSSVPVGVRRWFDLRLLAHDSSVHSTGADRQT